LSAKVGPATLGVFTSGNNAHSTNEIFRQHELKLCYSYFYPLHYQ
jgi:hypothetical protein